MAKMTLFEMKEKLYSLTAERQNVADWIAEKSADPSVSIEEIREKKKKFDEIEERISMLQKAHDAEEEVQRAKVATANGGGGGMTEKDAIIHAKAEFYRAALLGGDVSKSYQGLGGIPGNDADLGHGDNLLPTNVSNQLITDPIEANPLRAICRVTNISGYEEPKLSFTIEDADVGDVTDKQTAKEIAMDGDTVSYGRLKMKVSATVKDTVLHGTDTDLVARIEPNLRSALAKREKMYAFLSAEACALDSTHAHMSFYNAPTGTSVIQEVEGVDMYDAIVKAYADLADDYAANASVVMKKTDYYAMIRELANGSDTLFAKKPAEILGVPVVFCEKAVIPIVGDFSFYGINYDNGAIYETDKDAKKGEYYFVFTAWGDQQIRMKSAFRLAVVATDP